MGNILCNGEEIVMESNDGLLVLTNYRVFLDAKSGGISKHISIPLSGVSSCGIVTRSMPLLLVVAAISLVMGLVIPNGAAGVPLIFVAICFVIAYWATRSGVIQISPDGGEGIVVPTKSMKHEEIMHFIRAVIEQKHKQPTWR